MNAVTNASIAYLQSLAIVTLTALNVFQMDNNRLHKTPSYQVDMSGEYDNADIAGLSAINDASQLMPGEINAFILPLHLMRNYLRNLVTFIILYNYRTLMIP